MARTCAHSSRLSSAVAWGRSASLMSWPQQHEPLQSDSEACCCNTARKKMKLLLIQAASESCARGWDICVRAANPQALDEEAANLDVHPRLELRPAASFSVSATHRITSCPHVKNAERRFQGIVGHLHVQALDQQSDTAPNCLQGACKRRPCTVPQNLGMVRKRTTSMKRSRAGIERLPRPSSILMSVKQPELCCRSRWCQLE